MRIGLKEGHAKDFKSVIAFLMTEVIKDVDDDLLDYMISMIEVQKYEN